MKKYVFTIKEEICVAHGKDPAATELLKVLPHYGTVEDYDSIVADVKLDSQATIDKLTSHIKSIEEQELSDDEIALLRTYRANKESVTAAHLARENELTKQLQSNKVAFEQVIAKIKTVIGE
jgi:hypothetical protein